MAALEIALPETAAFGLQHRLLSPTEIAQVRIARDHDPFWLRQFLAGADVLNLADQTAVGSLVRNRLVGVETGVDKKLFGRTSHHEAVVRVVGFRQTFTVG